MNIALWIAVGFVVLLLVFWLYACTNLFFTQDRRFFASDGAPFGPDSALMALDSQCVRAQRGSELLRWHEVPCEGAERAWLIQYHGNLGAAAERVDFARELRQIGFRVFLIEYTSYAGGSGQATQIATLRNALAAFDELEARSAGKKICMVGESLGTGVATYVASQRKVQALVLSTPYVSMIEVASHRFPTIPMNTLVRHRMEAWRWAPQVTCPVLVLHGSADPVIPLSMGQRQAAHFKPAPELKIFEGVGHGEIRKHAPYWQAMRNFLAAHA